MSAGLTRALLIAAMFSPLILWAAPDDDDVPGAATPGAAVPGGTAARSDNKPGAVAPHVAAGQANSAAATELTTEQRDSVGIVTARPTAARLAERESALGQVLDPATLVNDHGQLEAALASERASNADLTRLQRLYHAEASSSLRMVQAAEAEHTRARTQYQAALATFNSHWSALAVLSASQLETLIGHAADGSHLLVRANLLGRQSIGKLPEAALLDVDGAQVASHVLGTLAQGPTELQSAAVLLEVSSAPRGLGPGARVPVTLLFNPGAGVLIPEQAVLYTEQGPRIFTQAAGTAGHWRFRQVPVELLQRRPEGWLVRGVETDDLLVVRGAGALWSLALTAAGAPADDDDD